MQSQTVLAGGMELVELSNRTITIQVCPALGGKIVSLRLNDTGQEMLWHNPNVPLQHFQPGAVYDNSFFGGVDELLPNDEKEQINGVDYPDHGELWTLGLDHELFPDGIRLTGRLPQTGFAYERTLRLDGDTGRLVSDYRIRNLRDGDNPFLWKMHAALRLQDGDRLICPASQGEIGDEDFTGRHGQRFFDWPHWGQDQLDQVPGADAGRCEFFFLSGLERGEFRHESPGNGTFFTYTFDHTVFPYAWYFASYGGWNGLYTGVLEPATAIPHMLSTSVKNETCPVLAPGGELSTQVVISVGRL